MKSIYVLGALLMTIFPAFSVESENKEEMWTVYVEDGKSTPQHVDLLPASTPLENYRENLARISPEMDSRYDVPNPGRVPSRSLPYDAQFLTVTELGPWHDFVVFDVRNDDARHRSIILRDESGNHRILYAQTPFSTMAESPHPYFADVQGNRLLVYRAPTGGTGNFHIEYYFLFDPESRLPNPLDLNIIDETLLKILPEGRAVWKGGGFDISTLTYRNAVWNKGDGNCCPTGGSVQMKLAIQDNALVIIESHYEPREEL